MKKILFLTALMLGLAATRSEAQQQVYTVVSSATYCGVTVSTTPVRIDNFNGGCEGLMSGRSEILVSVPVGVLGINYGFDQFVSTLTVSAKYGAEVAAGAKANIAVSSLVPVWAVLQGSSGTQVISVQQAKPQRQPGE